MRKKLVSLLLFFVIAGTLTSCSSTVTMTEKQSDLAAEYISSIILKYNQKESSSKLVALEETEITDVNPMDVSETKPVESTDAQQSAVTEQDKETANRKNVTLESLYGCTGVSITYNNVKEYKTYPTDGTEAITASEGCKFLAVAFRIKNNSDQEVDVDLLKSNVIFSMKMNGSDWISAMHTLLSDDMTYYQGKIKAGKSKETVVLFEVKESFRLSNASFFAFADNNKVCEVTIK